MPPELAKLSACRRLPETDGRAVGRGQGRVEGTEGDGMHLALPGKSRDLLATVDIPVAEYIPPVISRLPSGVKAIP